MKHDYKDAKEVKHCETSQHTHTHGRSWDLTRAAHTQHTQTLTGGTNGTGGAGRAAPGVQPCETLFKLLVIELLVQLQTL